MISIIICSKDPQMLQQCTTNFSENIGIEHEIIAFDNREKQWGLCRVYNFCASNARFPFLCFVHEDVLINTPNWGKQLLEFIYKTPNCGIISFVGGQFVPRNYIDWNIGKSSYSKISTTVLDHTKKGLRKINNVIDGYEEVLVTDGLFIFIRKVIWEEIKFDEVNFKEFHFYDSDFSFAVAQKYNNYICGNIDNIHFGISKFNKSFCENLVIFNKKWEKYKPRSCRKISFFQRIWSELSVAKRSIFIFKQNGYSLKEIYMYQLSINTFGFLLLLPFNIFVSIIQYILFEKRRDGINWRSL
ncbi:hypothetical protein GCM10027035_41230 [Emticicia sediminis]